jgi:predicted ATPase/DNA-binding SARP family transcriptional activator
MQFRLFGEVAAIGSHGEVDLGNGRSAAVLSMLLLEAGRVIAVERLVEELWGEESTEGSIHAVRVYVSRLRSMLSEAGIRDSFVVARSGGYMADVPRSAVDVLKFEDLVTGASSATGNVRSVSDLERALGLWTENPLAGFPYDEFAVRERHRFTELRLDATELWAELALEVDRSQDVVEFLTPVLQEHRFRERLWASLAIALYRRQRQTEAVRAIQTARSALSEVGLEVGPELADLESRILIHDRALRHQPDPPHNLPSPVDTFIGRDQELSTIDKTLNGSRLVTLVGAGGSGKTRLAVEAAWHLLDSYDRRAWLVDLAVVDSPEAVAETAVESLSIGPWSGKSPVVSVAAAIGDRRALLVLDNCDHLIDAAASFIEQLLRRCRELQVLATSREPLRIAGETVLKVPSLPVPPYADPDAELDDFEAAALFLDRAQRAKPDFDLTPTKRASIVEIVRMLDGIPLAIEMAAVRARSTPLPVIADQLDDMFASIGVGSRTALPRHQTLEAALDWSFDLLDEDEKSLFVQLGVVRAWFGVETAAAVAGTEDTRSIGRLLVRLVEKSLIVSTGDSEARYRLLEPVRQYAAKRLLESDTASAVENRRNVFFSSLAMEAGEGERRFEDPQWRRRFGRERSNLLLTVESLLSRGEADRAAAMTEVIARYWLELGLYGEGKRLIRSVLEPRHRAGTPARLPLMVGGAWLAVHQGDYHATEEWALEAITLADREGSMDQKASALNALGSLAAERGNMRLAASRLLQAQQLISPDDLGIYAPVTVNLAAVYAWAGELSRADTLADELERLPVAPSFGMYVEGLRGLTARMRGHLEDARNRLDKAIDELEKGGSEFHVALFRVERALVAFEEGDSQHASNLCAVVLNRADQGSTPLWPRMRAWVLSTRLAIAEGALDAARSILLGAIGEAETTGSVGVTAVAADAASQMALKADDRSGATRLLHAGSLLRSEIELARDAWESDEHAKTLSVLEGVDPQEDMPGNPPGLAELIKATITPR